ncbi:pyrokinin-1 receptor-like [Haliotis rufescens]|uniref:pyrokinin-1 receptor-like n=1 Tax=Haliotis rufescens TaxID=6454 RepID=UPI00201F3ADF|nr:pyrokinin-1 receptor-like [Haliotis rufescens]
MYTMERISVSMNGSNSSEQNLSSLDLSGLLSIENETHFTYVENVLTSILGAKRKDLASVTVLTVVYCVIFLTGMIGNVSTCIVIARNSYMHTVTNYYLLCLAISDVLTLILALPPELYSFWEAYPWRFGEPFCIFKSFLIEMTSNASVLTITGFTIERYIAICHPIRGQRTFGLSRAVKCICVIWILSGVCALPYPIYTRVFYFVTDPRTGEPIKESLLCNIPRQWQTKMTYMFQVSTFVFFVLPMTVITMMYIMIGMKLRKSEIASAMYMQSHSGKTAAARARKAVLKMLVAVVVAFFICWAPFHAQRLMTLYIKHEQWTPDLLLVQSHLFYVSGVLYFLSSTVNPILYNLLSRKFRQASKRTLCRCCLDLESLPAFYKLKAKFIGRAEITTSSKSERRYLDPEKPIRMAKFTNVEYRKANPTPGYPSTKETSMRQYTPSTSSSSGHAHSDGRLYLLCRHKYCSSRRARLNIEQTKHHRRFNGSYPNIEEQRAPLDYRRCLLMSSAVDSWRTERDKGKDLFVL